MAGAVMGSASAEKTHTADFVYKSVLKMPIDLANLPVPHIPLLYPPTTKENALH
jgi:hypothetical protein